MSFVEGLSGLNAASEHLSVLGNNIANSATVGFKTASVDFTNVLARQLNAANSGSPVQTGGGVLASNVMQSFSQGPINTTTVPLNAAIIGQGMFALKDPVLGQTVYTRNGQFTENTQGNLVNGSGFQVLDIAGAPIQLPVAPNDIRPGSTNTNQIDTVGFNSPLSPYGTVTFGGLSYTNTDGKTLTAAQVASLFSGLPANATPADIATRFSNTTGYPLYTPATTTLTFNDLPANQTVTVGGLTYTAGAGGALAATVAAAFAGLADGAGSGIANMSGAFSGVNTAGMQANGATLVINNTSNTSTASLAVSGSTPPTITSTSSPSVSGIFSGVLSNYSTQAAGATNTVQFNALTSGQSVTVAGLTYTAGVGGATATAIATAFANIANGSGGQLPNMTGNLTGVTTAGVQANNGSLVFSNTSINRNTPSISISSTGTAPAITASTVANIPTTYLGQNLSDAQQANSNWIQTTSSNFGPQPVITVTASGFLTGSTPMVETKTAGTLIAHLNTMAIDETGTIIGTYSDGLTSTIAQIGVATIPSYTGLKAVGNDTWVESSKSGVPVLGTAQLAGSKMQGSALEGSNENQTQDMVALLAAQQAYQASAQVVKIENQIYQTLIGMNG
jgi:flagellar hook-basal body protein